MFNGLDSKLARKACPTSVQEVARRKPDQLDSVASLDDLAVPPGNRLEKLAGNREGQYSVRINQQYRICFLWTVEGPDQVAIVDYH